VLLFLGSAAWAAPIAVTDDPLVIGGGARPLGMGRAFVAVADDSDAVFINPAGNGSTKTPQAMAMFTNLLGGDVYYTELCGAVPANFGMVGIGYISTGVNKIPSQVGSSEVYTDYYDSVLAINYSSALGRFFRYSQNVLVGINLKIFSRGFTGYYTEASSGFSSDIGLKYLLTPYLYFGLVRQNFIPISLGAGIRTGGGGVEEALAGVTKFGAAVKPKPLDGKLLLTADVDIPAQSTRPLTGHLGCEWKISPNVTVRGGADQSQDTSVASHASWNYTLGTSLSFGGFRMDYAYHPYYNDPELATSYFSFSYTGEPWFALKGRAE
jgi:hypothetical protein